MAAISCCVLLAGRSLQWFRRSRRCGGGRKGCRGGGGNAPSWGAAWQPQGVWFVYNYIHSISHYHDCLFHKFTNIWIYCVALLWFVSSCKAEGLDRPHNVVWPHNIAGFETMVVLLHSCLQFGRVGIYPLPHTLNPFCAQFDKSNGFGASVKYLMLNKAVCICDHWFMFNHTLIKALYIRIIHIIKYYSHKSIIR